MKVSVSGGDNKTLKTLHTRSLLHEMCAGNHEAGTTDLQTAHLVNEKAQTCKSQVWMGHK